MFHQAIVTTSMPVVSELYSRGDREHMKHYYQTMTKWTFMVNLPLSLILALFPEAILSIFGKSFVAGAPVLVLLALGNLVSAGTGICGVFLSMSGNTSFKLVNSIVSFVLTLGLNFWLIPRWGLIGAAVASAAATAVVNLLRLVQAFFLFRFLPYNASFIKPLVAGAVSCVFAWAVNQLLPADANLIYAFIDILILCAVYVVMILLLGLSLEDRSVLARLYARVRTVFSKRAFERGV
jgi:O-antigen/teichoic acid export membrane protein